MNAFLWMVAVIVVAVCCYSLGNDEGFENCASIKDAEIDRLWGEVRELREALKRARGGVS